MDFLVGLDHALFAKINLDWTNSFFDWLFPNITDLHKDARSLFVLLPLLAFWIYQQKSYAVKWIVLAIVSIGLADLFASRVAKPFFERQRPEPAGVQVVLRTASTKSFSFPSSHATNMFAAATVLSGGLPFLAPVFYFIAFLIAYSRIYVGVHFPFDVIAGAAIGSLMGFVLRWIFNRWLRKNTAPKLSENGLGDAIVRSAEGSFHGRK